MTPSSSRRRSLGQAAPSRLRSDLRGADCGDGTRGNYTVLARPAPPGEKPDDSAAVVQASDNPLEMYSMLHASLRCALLPLLLLSAVPSLGVAQDEYLLSGSGPREIGGFGGPVYRLTSVAGETMGMAGGGGSLLINRRLAIGGMGVGGRANVDAIIGGNPVRGEMDFGYGGLTLEYITRPSKLVHANYLLMVGGGGVSVWPDDSRPRHMSDSTEVFGVVEPQLAVELNVVRWMRIALTGGYRLTFGADVPKLVDDNLNGAIGSIVFRFGKF